MRNEKSRKTKSKDRNQKGIRLKGNQTMEKECCIHGKHLLNEMWPFCYWSIKKWVDFEKQKKVNAK